MKIITKRDKKNQTNPTTWQLLESTISAACVIAKLCHQRAVKCCFDRGFSYTNKPTVTFMSKKQGAKRKLLNNRALGFPYLTLPCNPTATKGSANQGKIAFCRHTNTYIYTVHLEDFNSKSHWTVGRKNTVRKVLKWRVNDLWLVRTLSRRKLTRLCDWFKVFMERVSLTTCWQSSYLYTQTHTHLPNQIRAFSG